MKQRKVKVGGPAPPQNVVRVFSNDTPGFKLLRFILPALSVQFRARMIVIHRGPSMVLMMALFFIGIVILCHIVSKFRRS